MSKKTTGRKPYYRIFLLTMWKEPSGEVAATTPWRFRLEEAHSGRQQLFADPASLSAAIQEIIATPEGEETEGEETEGGC